MSIWYRALEGRVDPCSIRPPAPLKGIVVGIITFRALNERGGCSSVVYMNPCPSGENQSVETAGIIHLSNSIHVAGSYHTSWHAFVVCLMPCDITSTAHLTKSYAHVFSLARVSPPPQLAERKKSGRQVPGTAESCCQASKPAFQANSLNATLAP